jgi:hypothetical protein
VDQNCTHAKDKDKRSSLNSAQALSKNHKTSNHHGI